MPQPGQPDYDKLFKVREFLEDLMANFRLNYNPLGTAENVGTPLATFQGLSRKQDEKKIKKATITSDFQGSSMKT